MQSEEPAVPWRKVTPYFFYANTTFIKNETNLILKDELKNYKFGFYSYLFSICLDNSNN